MTDITAPLHEVFASIQGEGAFAGEPQVFVRFAVCPVRCLYCDTEDALVRVPAYRVHTEECVQVHANPATVAGVRAAVEAVERPSGLPRTISLTGGEPLVHATFLGALIPTLRERRRVHLETAGLHPRALGALLDQLDHVSIDWKLPSTLEGPAHEDDHEACLKLISGSSVDAAVKLVIPANPPRAELERAFDVVARHTPGSLVFLQPVTPCRQMTTSPTAEELDPCVDLALGYGLRVRLLPQIHKLVGRR
ncbi:MAG: 7-carboxy-7-deazaguanine synthase QueE [Planctomycetes bacterium]|nr:7-carboxy-7-deazaguanine synthase QueE [Planctomycetota bacterium]